MQHVSHHPSSSRQQKISTLQRKPSNHSERNSSSKQTSTYHPNEGFYDSGDRDLDNVQSGWRPIQVRASPFGDHSEEFVDSDNAVQIFDTPPHSCSEDEQQPRIVRQKSGIHAADGPERTKSKLLSDIAEQVSRGQYMRPGHSRKSSGDSQDSCRDPLRRAKKRRWNLSKAFSAPEEDVYGALEAGNWAQQMYHQERAYQGQLHSHRPEYGALRGRAVGRKRYTGRYRTSKYIGVGSSNRKTQWQARILVQGKVTHLGYYPSEEEAARVYDRVALSLNPGAQTNFPASQYPKGGSAEFSGLGREDLQRALGVKPMDKSSRFRGVSRKKGKWEAKVMVNRKWAYRALFDSEDEAAHAYDAAVWRLKPKEASSFINFKDGVSVRDSPKQSLKSQPQNMGAPRLPETSPIKLEEPEDVLASEPVMLTELNIPEHDENEIMDEAPVFLCSEPLRSQSVQLPLRSQSEQLPIYGSSSLARTESCQVQLQALNQAPSLPNDLSLVNQGSLNVNLPPLAVSPQQSMCDQPCLPALPSLAVPVMDLPDPNSIGVPPPENLPYPELVTGPSAEILPGGGPLRSATSTPTHVTSNLLPGQLTHSPSRTSSGLPPLPALTGRSSHPSSEANARYVPGSQTSLNPATPRSQYTEYRPEVHLQANPFYDVASIPVSTVSAETCGLSHAVSIDNQASVRSAMELGSQINRATSEGILRSSSIARELPYSSSLPEVAPAVCLAPHLSHSTSLASLNTAHYYQPGPPTADIAGDLFPGSNVSPMESTISYDHVRSLANSRSASSSFLHSAQSANNGLLRTSSTNPGLPLYHVPEMRMVGHELPQATIHINNGLPIDPNFMGRPDLTPAQIVNLNSPNLPVARTLNAEQADLLANLDVDVEANDPISINPVQIGGEDMNVYSAHIMGNVLH